VKEARNTIYQQSNPTTLGFIKNTISTSNRNVQLIMNFAFLQQVQKQQSVPSVLDADAKFCQNPLLLPPGKKSR
jgi:hypothetical protein